jgi:hypothetical protein
LLATYLIAGAGARQATMAAHHQQIIIIINYLYNAVK